MTSTIDPTKIGKPQPAHKRRHVRTLTGAYSRSRDSYTHSEQFWAGYIPETDEKGHEKWPRGEEKVWKAGLRGVDKGMCLLQHICVSLLYIRATMALLRVFRAHIVTVHTLTLLHRRS